VDNKFIFSLKISEMINENLSYPQSIHILCIT